MYTIPYAVNTGGEGLSGVMVHYRLQVLAGGTGTPAFSPRVSFIAPGSASLGEPASGAGWEVNLPISEQMGDAYLHGNIGFSRIRREPFSSHVAGSAVWRARAMLHPLVETVLQWGGRRIVTVSPGIRIGWNRGDSQLVVGIAAPIAWSERSSTLAGFGYL